MRQLAASTFTLCFAIESSIDEIAALVSKDPLEFRLELLAGKPRHLQVLKVVAERAGWGHAPTGHYQGIAFMEGYTSHIAQMAEVSVDGGRLKVHRITCVIDCGQTVNPRIVESQLESGIVYGLTAALWGEITLHGGRVQQSNFNDYRMLRKSFHCFLKKPGHVAFLFHVRQYHGKLVRTHSRNRLASPTLRVSHCATCLKSASPAFTIKRPKR